MIHEYVTSRGRAITWAVAAVAVATTAVGLIWNSEMCLVAGTIGVIGVAVVVIHRRRTQLFWEWSPRIQPPPNSTRLPLEPDPDEHSLVSRMLEQGRCALLLRPQIASELDDQQFQAVAVAFAAQMALVPQGPVAFGSIDDLLDEGRIDVHELDRRAARVVKVNPVFLDRYAVSNAAYFEFVSSGGYDQMTIWDEEIWPAVLDFVDETGHPGPRHWKDGCYLPGEERLPVVGVSWYEAAAYARWVGKRLPTDAEWVKAGCWPIVLKGGAWHQRRYPWGNAFDHTRANVWGSQPNALAPVDAFPEGVSVGGVCQLIGNTWEWTTSSFGAAGDPTIAVSAPMKSIRGGAYDTYFESQATCHFQSGEPPLSRKHNIGFRLALSAADLSPRFGQSEVDNTTADEASVPEIVGENA